MIVASLYHDKIIAVLGFGKTGLAACASLTAGGATVWAWDDSPVEREKAAVAGFIVKDLHTCDWDVVDGLLPSPGIGWTHPIISAAIKTGCPLLSDVDILFEHVPNACFIGITGTNGKSTTTALIHHILQSSGMNAVIGGNFGVPTLSLSPDAEVYVLEMSSYQLELLEKTRFHTGIFLNLTADHLERHSTMENYFAAKMRLFAGQQRGDTAIVGVDDAYGQRAFGDLVSLRKQHVVPISSQKEITGGYFTQYQQLVDATTDTEKAVLDLSKAAALLGTHNAQNIAASFAAAKSMGLDDAPIALAIHRFKGLAHRQEVIATIGNVTYINDSKATNADAAAKALACYDTIYWIIGGRPKTGGLKETQPFYPKIKKAYCVGEAMEAFADEMRTAGIPFEKCGTLETAVAAARRDAQQQGGEAVVLLSPACASWDQFANFEARGDAFRGLVLQAGI